MAKSKIGFHTGPGGIKQGLGDWERKLNEAGQAFGMKAADEYGPIDEALRIGRKHGVENWLGFRFTKASGKVSREVPDYDSDPRLDAPRLCQEVIDKLPPEFDRAVWLEIINEPRAQNKGEDTMFAGMNACDYLGEWCLAAARFLNGKGYKFMGPSFNSGEPGFEGFPMEDAVVQYSQPGMLNFLRYCADNPDKAALSVHEYSWSNWKDGQTAADWYPGLWGRFEAAIAAADLNGIPRTFPIFVTEFGFAHREAPSGEGAHPFLDARNQMTARWPQLKYDASWTLQQGWGSIDANVNTWLRYDASTGFDEGQQPAATHPAFGGTLPGSKPARPHVPEEGEGEEETESPGETQTPGETGAEAEEIFRLAYTGFGVKDVGDAEGSWYDVGNVQVPIIDGRKMTYWEAEGDNPFGDGQPWNDFGLPEGVYRWDAHLPEHEHFFLNDEGRCYHLFAPASAWWVRFADNVHLTPGAYRLSLDLWGDWVDLVDGQKVPKSDPGHARVELFLDEAGKEIWLRPEYSDQSTLQKTFTVEEAGEYEAGFGILTVFAPGDKPGANGCFLRSFTLARIQSAGGPRPSPGTVPGSGESAPGHGEVSRQSITLSPRTGIQAIRLEVRRRVGDQWRRQLNLTQYLEGESRIDIVYLGDAAAPPPEGITEPGEEEKKAPGVKPIERVLGMDISWAQDMDVDFRKAAEAGVKFVFIRAGSGRTARDANFEHHYKEAGKVGMFRGIYYYLYPESEARVGEADDRTPEGQARRFAAMLKDGAELGAALDVEEGGLTADEVKRFVDEFQKHDPYGRPITIYTRASFWQNALGASAEELTWAAEHPLWVAHFASSTRLVVPDGAFEVAIPEPWGDYVIHQWTSVGGSAVGQEKENLDLNYFSGSEGNLKAWARDVAARRAAEFERIGTKIVTAAAGLWLRDGPSTEFNKIKLMERGTAVEVIEEGSWDFLRVGDDVGYASSHFLKSETDGETETPAAPGAYHYQGPARRFYTGLHGPADDAAWTRPGFKDKIRKLGLPLVFMSNGINPDFADMGDPARNVVRLYWNPEKVSADKAYEYIRDDQLKRWWEKGYRRFIFFNEPQLTREHGQAEEGMKIAWNSAEEFANFLKTCLSRARKEFEGIYLYTTPVTSNEAFDPWSWRAAIWKHNKKLVDAWCMHAYSGNNSNVSAAVAEILDQVKTLQRHFRLHIPIIVSEASVNRGDDAEQKARVALSLAKKAAQIPGLEAVFWYAADWDPSFDKHNEGWFRKGIADAYLRLRNS
jgi:GH25 family lysozyme M1 (1,4-beta-N-acetylmuramidase)